MTVYICLVPIVTSENLVGEVILVFDYIPTVTQFISAMRKYNPDGQDIIDSIRDYLKENELDICKRDVILLEVLR